MQARHCWLMALLVLAGPLSVRAEEGVTWAAGVDAARQQAAESNRLVLLHFWAPWCPPCRNLEKNVFNKPPAAEAMARDFVAVKLNVDDHKQLAQALQVGPIPCDVVITPQGQFVHRTISPASVEKYVARLGEMAVLGGRRKNTEVHRGLGRGQNHVAVNPSPAATPQGAAAAPAPQTWPAHVSPPYGQQLIDGRPSGTDAPPAGASPPAGNAGAPGSAAHPQPTWPAAESTGPKWYERMEADRPADAPPTIGQNQGSPSVAAPQAGNPAAPPEAPKAGAPEAAGPKAGVEPKGPFVGRDSTSGARQGATPWSSGAGAPAVGTNVGAKLGTSNPAPQGGSANVSSEADPPAASTPPAAGGQPPQVPAGNPPLGFDGYCVVSMQDEHKWVKGDVRYGVIHRNRTYLFASEEYQQKFYREPDKYAPILAGHDPVLMVETGKEVPGSRLLGAYYIDRDGAGRPVFRCLCLFASEESLTKFETNSRVYVDRLRQARVPGTMPK
ncbi:MAG: thioredoxin family protein [Planctomycetia bacterium]|nr:thioredoxin family protein [Planctomycetia bacterium]